MAVPSIPVQLLVVRHARPFREEAPAGQSADPGLAEIGRHQAEVNADFLARESIDHVVSSTMRRSLETAEPLAERLGLPIEELDELRESDHRAGVYVPSEEMTRDDPATAHYWEGDLIESVFPDGYDSFRDRVLSAFEHVISTNRSRNVAVFCHGMVTSVYLQCLLGFEDPMAVQIDYCGITRVLAATTGRRTVRSVNETCHVRHLLER